MDVTAEKWARVVTAGIECHLCIKCDHLHGLVARVERYVPSCNVLWQPHRSHPSRCAQTYLGNDHPHQTGPCHLPHVNVRQPHVATKAACVNKDKHCKACMPIHIKCALLTWHAQPVCEHIQYLHKAQAQRYNKSTQKNNIKKTIYSIYIKLTKPCV